MASVDLRFQRIDRYQAALLSAFQQACQQMQQWTVSLLPALSVPVALVASGHANAFLRLIRVKFHHKELIATVVGEPVAGVRWRAGRCVSGPAVHGLNPALHPVRARRAALQLPA